MSGARLSGPTEARTLALAEIFGEAISDRLMLDPRARGLLALVQELDAHVCMIDASIHGVLLGSGKPLTAGIELRIPALGVCDPKSEIVSTRRGRAPRRKVKPRRAP